MSRKDKNQGFTIIELLIATAIFSVVLLVFVTAFLHISELFYKGVNLSNTQEAARNLIQNISNDIQFTGGNIQNFPSQSYFCIGAHRYSYVKGTQYDPTSGTNYGVIKETRDCAAPTGPDTPNLATAEELLDPGMQLNDFQMSCNLGLCNVSVHVVYYGTDSSVLSPTASDPKAACSGPINSTQFCATADYQSTILQKP